MKKCKKAAKTTAEAAISVTIVGLIGYLLFLALHNGIELPPTLGVR